MKRFQIVQVLVVSVFVLSLAIAVPRKKRATKDTHKPQLLVFLIDGFRWDYIQHQRPEDLPGLNRILREGVQAAWVNPIFPSLSYPGWTTLTTGLYAESHHIVGNYFYDNHLQKSFNLFNTSVFDAHWWSAEPIWITATRHGKRVALYLWSSCNVPYRGALPEYCQVFENIQGWQKFEENVNHAFDKLEEGFDLVMVYTEHVDMRGHQFGPISPELRQALREVDTVLLSVQNKLEERELDNTVNIMIISDHGMVDGSTVQYVEITDYINMDDVRMIIDRAAVASVVPLPGRAEEVQRNLKRMPGVDVYLKDNIPEKYRYRRGRYVQEIIVVAKPGFCIAANDHSKFFPPDPPGLLWGGFHGYGPEVEDMRTVFMGKGPAFKKNYLGQPLEMVDLYQIYTHILGVPPEPNNGTFDSIRSYFKPAPRYDRINFREL